MNYDEMSWEEINIAVTSIVQNCKDWNFNKENNYFYWKNHGLVDIGIIPVTDYSKVENAWPIIVDNMISIEFDAEDQCDSPASWCNARSLLTEHSCIHQKNPIRAAMICFLMMNDVK